MTPRAPSRTPVRDAPSPMARLSASTRHVTFAWELSSLDPPVARARLATLADRRTRDAYDRCLPNPSNEYGHPDPFGHHAPAGAMRTTFHDVVARFGDRGPRPPTACSAVRASGSDTSDVPVVLRRRAAQIDLNALLGGEPRSIRVGPRERDDPTPTRNASIPTTPRLHVG